VSLASRRQPQWIFEMTITVSAIIPAFNAATTIGRAIESALIQTAAVTEIIVVDDGSQDNTSRIAESYGVKVKSLPRQSGAAIARNIAIECAVGEYLAFLDADDEWLPDKISKQLNALKPETVLVSCHSLYVSSRPHANILVNYDRPPATGPDAWKTLLAYSFISASSALARRNDVIAAGMFDPNSCPAEDQDLWIKLARRGEVQFVEDILL
jgi:glycosyltransferase involved in cell wall biosynthesis